jgi:hypothetical protein
MKLPGNKPDSESPRYHVISGSGIPVTAHVSTTIEVSENLIRIGEDPSSIIRGGACKRNLVIGNK